MRNRVARDVQARICGGPGWATTQVYPARGPPEDQIPELSMTRNVPSQITRMFEHYRHPDLPADFD